MITLYGISNCDTMRKAGKWLDSQDIEWVLHDYRKQGLDLDLAETLVSVFGIEDLINKRGTTWRKLVPELQQKLTDPALAPQLIMSYPALIKRPIAFTGSRDWLIGYDQLLTLAS